MKKRNCVLGCPGVGDSPNPVVAQVPSAEFQIVSEAVFRESLTGGCRVIAPKLLVMAVHAENGNFILDLDHEYRVSLGINILDVPYESAERGDLSLDDGFVVVRNRVVVCNAVRINSARIRFVVGNDLHRRIQITSEICIDGAVAAGVMTEPVQD